MARQTLAERFHAKYYIDLATGCWLWLAAKNEDGYGHIGIGPSRCGLAHRVSYELFRGKIPVGMKVCHHCDAPDCVNPDHLFLGTDADNSTDRDNKGRLAFGVRNGRAKLDDAKAIEIRQHIKSGASERTVAGMYNVSRNTVRAIKAEKTWQSQRLTA
jgi:hypothetical protein